MKQEENSENISSIDLLSQATDNIKHVFYHDLPLGAAYLKIIGNIKTPEPQILKSYQLIRTYIKDQNIAEIIVSSLKIIRKLCLKDPTNQLIIDHKAESLIEMQVIKDIATGSQSNFINLTLTA